MGRLALSRRVGEAVVMQTKDGTELGRVRIGDNSRGEKHQLIFECGPEVVLIREEVLEGGGNFRRPRGFNTSQQEGVHCD